MDILQRGEDSKIILTGKHSYGLQNLNIQSWGEGANLYVGGFCSIAGDQTIFLGGNHRVDWGTTFPFGHKFQDIFPAGQINGKGHPATKGDVVIENDVWIGERCTILSGVRLGSGSVIGANAVITKDVAPYTVVAGNPGKTIRQRFPDHIIQALLEIGWWNYSDQAINDIVPLLQDAPTDERIREIRMRLADAT